MDTFYITNAIPDSFWSEAVVGHVSTISQERAQELIDSLPDGFTSGVGHESTAQLFTSLLSIDVPMNRIEVRPTPGDTVLAGVFTPPRRLEAGERWTEDEILSIPVKWVLIRFGAY